MKNKNISNLQNNKSGQYNLANKCNHVVVTDINKYKMKKHRISWQTIFLSILLISILLLIIQNSMSIGDDRQFDRNYGINPPTSTTKPTTPTTPTTTSSIPEAFDLQKVDTWHLNWAQIKTNLKSDQQGINQKWSAATSADRLTSITALIKKTPSQLTLTNLESSQLTLDENGRLTLTNGKYKAYLDLENLPKDLEKLEYNEQEKAFIYTFKESKMTIRNGILNSDFTITGTDWPSNGLKWNQRGEFRQTEEGVSLKGDSTVYLENMEIKRARKNQDAFAVFRPREEGKKYVKGKNLDVSIKDSKGEKFLRVITPAGKETEVFIGNLKPDNEKQYVQLSEDGKEIKITGDEIGAELLTDKLKEAVVDGDKVTIKNKEILYKVEDDKNGKSQTYHSKQPRDGESINIKNKRNPQGNIITQNIPNPFEGDPSLVTAPEPSQDTPPTTNPPVTTPPTTTTQQPTRPTTNRQTTTTTSNNNRVRQDSTLRRPIRLSITTPGSLTKAGFTIDASGSIPTNLRTEDELLGYLLKEGEITATIDIRGRWRTTVNSFLDVNTPNEVRRAIDKDIPYNARDGFLRPLILTLNRGKVSINGIPYGNRPDLVNYGVGKINAENRQKLFNNYRAQTRN